MKNYVVESYENYREEDRLSTNNVRRIEFLTTTRIFNEIITNKKDILDCAAGTGIYSFYLADKGHNVTATDGSLAKQILQTGELRHDDEKCFWTDTYYSTSDEMESLYMKYGLEVIDHFAQDGVTPLLSDKIDGWNEEDFKVWCEYHYSICREKSLLGASNHLIIVGKK